MSKLVLVVLLLLVQVLILQVQAMAYESEAQAPVSVHDQKTDKVEDHQISGATTEDDGESKAAEAPHIRRLGKHHSTDKSVAGGGVIIGGLVTAIFAAVFCYIRVTRKRDTHC